MASVRGRLTLAYFAALFGTMLVFAVVLREARRAAVSGQLESQAAADVERVSRVIEQARETGEPLTIRRDSVPAISPALQARLEGVPDYVMVLDTADRVLYASFSVRQLTADDFFALFSAALRERGAGRARTVRLSSDELILAQRADTLIGQGIEAVVAGVSTRAAALAPRELVGTMLAVAPLVLLLSLGLAYVIAGQALRPVERIINEVEAITDGRSLHRRLPVERSGDELARLVTTLNAMMARLETSFAGLRRFTADASHELRTPLAVLRADVERAMSPKASTTEHLVALEEAMQEVARMTDLVDSLLTLARADEGRFDLHREPIRMEPLVREVFETAVILGEDAGLRVSMPIMEDALVMGDRPRLRQMLLNLITNAIKYTPRGGAVDVSLLRHDSAALVSVRDSGIGISAADLPYIFDRFWRADRVRSRSAERGGFGLGLAISQYIAQAHGGTLTATSRLGRGTTFLVTLPLAGRDGPENGDRPVPRGDAGGAEGGGEPPAGSGAGTGAAFTNS